MHIRSCLAAGRAVQLCSLVNGQPSVLIAHVHVPAATPMEQAFLSSSQYSQACFSGLRYRASTAICRHAVDRNSHSQLSRGSRWLPRAHPSPQLHSPLNAGSLAVVKAFSSGQHQEYVASSPEAPASPTESPTSGQPWRHFLTALQKRGYFSKDFPRPTATT